MVPALRGISYGQMIANASVISYYTCLIALAVYYLVSEGVSPFRPSQFPLIIRETYSAVQINVVKVA